MVFVVMGSSIASPICQSRQSGKTFTIVAFSSQFSFFFLILSLFYLLFPGPLFSLYPIFGNFFAVKGSTLSHCSLLVTPLLLEFIQKHLRPFISSPKIISWKSTWFWYRNSPLVTFEKDLFLLIKKHLWRKKQSCLLLSNNII